MGSSRRVHQTGLMINPTPKVYANATVSRHELFPARELETLRSGRVRVPDPRRLVHLQLRRFAGCPICSLHLRSFARRHAELVSAGIVEVAVFHSSAKDLSRVHLDQPFAVVPDPKKELYAELGVGTSAAAMLHPKVWAAAARALGSGAGAHAAVGGGDGSLGLPGDFLIEPDGRIVACYRGKHADDQWSVDDVLDAAKKWRAAP
jgi:peroxiredoxin